MTEQKKAMTRVAKDAVKSAKDKAGRGWSLIGYDLQRALISAEIVSVLLAQAQSTASDDIKVMQDIARTAFTAHGDRP